MTGGSLANMSDKMDSKSATLDRCVHVNSWPTKREGLLLHPMLLSNALGSGDTLFHPH